MSQGKLKLHLEVVFEYGTVLLIDKYGTVTQERERILYPQHGKFTLKILMNFLMVKVDEILISFQKQIFW